MPEDRDPRALEQMILTRALRLNVVVQGIVTGLVAGLAIFLATNWLVFKGGEVVGPHLSLLSQFLVGYRVSFVGSLVGFAYGAAGGCLLACAVATAYNSIAGRREHRRGAR